MSLQTLVQTRIAKGMHPLEIWEELIVEPDVDEQALSDLLDVHDSKEEEPQE